jgi:hypothetical protein
MHPNKPFIFNMVKLVLRMPSHILQRGRLLMIAMLHFATLIIATIFSAGAAAGLHWLFLQAAFLLMRPATARRISFPTGLVRGTSQLARAYVSNR